MQKEHAAGTLEAKAEVSKKRTADAKLYSVGFFRMWFILKNSKSCESGPSQMIEASLVGCFSRVGNKRSAHDENINTLKASSLDW